MLLLTWNSHFKVNVSYVKPGASCFGYNNQLLYNISNTGMAFLQSLLHYFKDFALDEIQLKRPEEIKCILEAAL